MNNEQLDLIQDTLDRLMNDIKALHIQLEALKYIKGLVYSHSPQDTAR